MSNIAEKKFKEKMLKKLQKDDDSDEENETPSEEKNKRKKRSKRPADDSDRQDEKGSEESTSSDEEENQTDKKLEDPDTRDDEVLARKTKRLGKPTKIVDPKKPKVKIDFDPTIDEAMDFIMDGDFSDIEEHYELYNEILQETISLDETLSIAARLRKKASLRRNRNRMKIARQRSMRRRATTQRINQRARRSAINAMKRKFAGGRPLNKLSYADRARVERIVSRRQRAVSNLTRRNVRIKRQQERDRFNHRRTLRNSYETNKDVLNEYELYMNHYLSEWTDTADEINYNEEMRDVCASLNITPKELDRISRTFGKYANELTPSQAKEIVTKYRKKYDS